MSSKRMRIIYKFDQCSQGAFFYGGKKGKKTGKKSPTTKQTSTRWHRRHLRQLETPIYIFSMSRQQYFISGYSIKYLQEFSTIWLWVYWCCDSRTHCRFADKYIYKKKQSYKKVVLAKYPDSRIKPKKKVIFYTFLGT